MGRVARGRTGSKPRRGPVKPTLTRERAFWDAGMSRIAGVDEVGVAPTCGAVVAAAVIMPPNGRRIPGIRDSKTLSALQRERLVPVIRRRAVAIGVGAASVFGWATKHTELAFQLPWQLLVLSAGAVILICVGSALVSMLKVIRLEPAIVFRS